MKIFNKILLTLGLVIGSVSLVYSQSVPENAVSERIIRGKFKQPSELADTWDEVWDKVNDNTFRLDTMLFRIDAEGGGGGGTSDHGSLTGLGDDDHSIYYNLARLTAWTGSSNIATIGTIGTGVWQGTAIANGYLTSTLTGKTYNGVTLTTGGSSSNYLDETGNYSVPSGGSIGTSIDTDTIDEYTSDHGVLIDGVLVKDNDVIFPGNNYLQWVNSDNMIAGDATSNLINFAAGGSTRLQINSNNISFMRNASPNAGNTYDFGSSGLPWKDMYTNGIIFNPKTTGTETEGYSYYDSDDNYLKLWDGTAWDTLNIGSVGGGGGSSLWQKSSTNLSPLTSGDDILLNGSTERLNFDDANTSIYWTAGTMFFTSTNNLFDFSGTGYFSGDVYGTNDVSDLGDPVAFYADLYANNHFIEDTDTEIGLDGSGNMTLEDVNTGLKTLAQLADPIGSDTVSLGEVVRLLQDTITLWAIPLEDSSQFETGVMKYGWKFNGPDTMYVSSTDVVAIGASSNFTYNVHWASDLSGSDTDMFTSAVQVSGSDAITTGEIDTPNTSIIPPDVYIWIQFYDVTTKPVNGAWFNFMGYEY